jgi:hypothetical protein
MKTVHFTQDEYQLMSRLLFAHYDQLHLKKIDKNQTELAYGAIISMRLAEAEKAWEEYQSIYPAHFRMYETREEFLKDQYTIYPEDLEKMEAIAA